MSRATKIRKLANAIREYRGRTSTPVGTPADRVKWMIPPNPKKLTNIVIWLERLSLPVEESVKKIEAFQHTGQFQEWLRGIE